MSRALCRSVPLIVALALAGGPAVAVVCPGVIAETDWSDGYTLRIAGREGDVAVQELRGPGGEVLVSRLHAGLVLLQAQGVGEPELYIWDTALPAPGALVPEAVFVLDGGRELAGGRMPVRVTLTVLGAESLEVAGCSYPVVVTETVLEMGDSVPVPLTVWMHLPSLMPLRQEWGSPHDERLEVTALR